jgi:hypothetical protein
MLLENHYKNKSGLLLWFYLLATRTMGRTRKKREVIEE